ncbi:MAG: helix-turn-helix domain-containing protein, partial [Alicyclobacillus sp.]|nr:helix-turn-helix domain-containing protein [Alicyclobacillus sp.]
MQIHRAYRYEFSSNRAPQHLLAKHAGVARFAYNWGLARRIALYEETGQGTNAIGQYWEPNRLKKSDFLWIYEVSKCAPQEALRDLDRAFHHFFRG